MAYEVVLLTDILPQIGFFIRPAGAYLVSNELDNHGVSSIVIDYISRNDDIFSYILDFIDEHTLVLGISMSFLNKFDNMNIFFDMSSEISLNDDIFDDDWFGKLRETLDTVNPNIQICLGGHGTQYPRIQSKKHIDKIFVGASEVEFSNYVLDLKRGRSNTEHVVDVVTKPYPRKVSWKQKFQINEKEWLPLSTSRGCRFNCTFCAYTHKKILEYKDKTDLRQEIMRNYETNGTTSYVITDECFNDSAKKIDQLLDLFTSLPFIPEWNCAARIEPFITGSMKIKDFIDAGMRGIYFGIETLNRETGTKIGKGMDPERIKEGMVEITKITKGVCLSNMAFIIGLPGDTRNTLEQTLSFIMDQNSIDFVQIQPLFVFPIDRKYHFLSPNDFSINPDKHGYTVGEPYWSNDIMTFDEACEIRNSWFDVIKSNPYTTPDYRGYHMYPRFRSLGLNHEDASKVARNSMKILEYDVRGKSQDWVNRYFRSLKEFSFPDSHGGT